MSVWPTECDFLCSSMWLYFSKVSGHSSHLKGAWPNFECNSTAIVEPNDRKHWKFLEIRTSFNSIAKKLGSGPRYRLENSQWAWVFFQNLFEILTFQILVVANLEQLKFTSYTYLWPVGQFAEKRAILRPVGHFFRALTSNRTILNVLDINKCTKIGQKGFYKFKNLLFYN